MKKLLAILLALSVMLGCFSAVAEEAAVTTLRYDELPAALLSSILQAVTSGKGASITVMDGKRSEICSLGVLPDALSGSPVLAVSDKGTQLYANDQSAIVSSAGSTIGVRYDTIQSAISNLLSSSAINAGLSPEQLGALAGSLLQNLSSALSAVSPSMDYQTTDDGHITTMSLSLQQLTDPLIEAVVNTIDQNTAVVNQILVLIGQTTGMQLPTADELSMYLKGASRSIGLMAGQMNITCTEKVAGRSTEYTLNVANGMAVFTYAAGPGSYSVSAAVNGRRLSGSVSLKEDTLTCRLDLDDQSLVLLDLTAGQNECAISGHVGSAAVTGLITLSGDSLQAVVSVDDTTCKLSVLSALDGRGFTATLTVNDSLLVSASAFWSDTKGFVSLTAGDFTITGDYSWSNFLLDANASLNGIPFHLSMDFQSLRNMMYGRKQNVSLSAVLQRTLRTGLSGLTLSAQVGELRISCDVYYDTEFHISVPDLFTAEYRFDRMDVSAHLGLELRTGLSRGLQAGKYTLDITRDSITYTNVSYTHISSMRYTLADETSQYSGHLNVMHLSATRGNQRTQETIGNAMIVTDAVENGYEISIRESMEENAEVAAIIRIDLDAAPVQLPQDVQYLTENEIQQYLTNLPIF